MLKFFTTGELAKICNVSIRTVQFYDRENIVKPSKLSDGGRRLYTEEEVKKFRCICLYKALGFSLDEIKKVSQTQNPYGLLSEIVFSQRLKIEEEIKSLEQMRARLGIITEQISEAGKVEVESIDDLEELMRRKERHKRTDVMTYIFLACYVLLLLAGFPIAVSLGGFAPGVMVVAAVILLSGLIFYHSQVNSYVCPVCGKRFSIGFLKDAFSFNDIGKGKYLKCPSCGRKGWFKETYFH